MFSAFKKGISKAVKIVDQTFDTGIVEKIAKIKFKELGIGTMIDLKIENNSIKAKLLLDGESTPINIDVVNYEIVEGSDSANIKINSLFVDRPWMNVLAKKQLVGKSFPIPSEFKDYLEILK